MTSESFRRCTIQLAHGSGAIPAVGFGTLIPDLGLTKQATGAALEAEGSWAAGGHTTDTDKISKLIGATEGPARLAEAFELGAKMKNARLS